MGARPATTPVVPLRRAGRPPTGPTTTSAFGVGRREGHDASGFYARFPPPRLSDDDAVARPTALDSVWVGDARDMDAHGSVADGSVALVVTSPPYFAGKEYEQAMGVGHVPADFADYLGMLRDVFAQCFAKLEPGGRIAVNVANLGRKPYRSLSADVVTLLEGLGYLLRGEIVWQKSHAAGGSCAWGTYQRPGNPVLRDVSERIVVASKGRFDRAVPADERARAGLPHEGTMTMDEFVDATTDVWDLPAESATRVGHPAPFPVELPRRLIELYTYRGDLVLDPFMGSGSTAVAAVRTERHFVGFDTDPDYVALAERRAAEERAAATGGRHRVTVAPTRTVAAVVDATPQDRAVAQGAKARDLAEQALADAGFTEVEVAPGLSDLGVSVDYRARDAGGRTWLFLLDRGVLGHPARPPAARRAVAGPGGGVRAPRGPVGRARSPRSGATGRPDHRHPSGPQRGRTGAAGGDGRRPAGPRRVCAARPGGRRPPGRGGIGRRLRLTGTRR